LESSWLGQCDALLPFPSLLVRISDQWIQSMQAMMAASLHDFWYSFFC
jgi:hypothetical protein